MIQNHGVRVTTNQASKRFNFDSKLIAGLVFCFGFWFKKLEKKNIENVLLLAGLKPNTPLTIGCT